MSGPQLETRQLRYFLAVAEHGTLTRAADHLHIAQPSLSQAIARMEQQLGLPLFHRVGRRVVLSEAGRDLLEPCRRALRTVQAAEDAARGALSARRGRLVVATMPSTGISPGAELIADFLTTRPGVSISALGGLTAEEVTDLVRQGSAEVGLIAAARLHRDKDLVVIPLRSQRLVLVSGGADALPDRDELTVEDLGGCRLITSHPGSVMRELVDDVLARQPGSTIACEVDHRTSILPLVLAGVGPAILPEAWEGLAVRAGLRVRTLTDAPGMWSAALCRRAGLTPLATDFMECVQRLRQTSRSSSASIGSADESHPHPVLDDDGSPGLD